MEEVDVVVFLRFPSENGAPHPTHLSSLLSATWKEVEGERHIGYFLLLQLAGAELREVSSRQCTRLCSVSASMVVPASWWPPRAPTPGHATLVKLIELGRDCRCGFVPLLNSRGRQLQFSVCSIKSEGNRRGRSQKKSASDTPVEEEEKLKGSIPVKEPSELSTNEEILALLRRIQSSISKGERVVRKKRNTRKDSQSPKRASDAQRQDPKQKQVGAMTSSSLQRVDQPPPQQRDTSSKDENIVNASASESSKQSRRRSNFVKRSPIPLASLPRESPAQVVGEELPATAREDTLPGVQKVDGLKLSELKELAKSRGIRGYSKLKKGQLLDLLKKLPNLE